MRMSGIVAQIFSSFSRVGLIRALSRGMVTELAGYDTLKDICQSDQLELPPVLHD